MNKFNNYRLPQALFSTLYTILKTNEFSYRLLLTTSADYCRSQDDLIGSLLPTAGLGVVKCGLSACVGIFPVCDGLVR